MIEQTQSESLPFISTNESHSVYVGYIQTNVRKLLKRREINRTILNLYM